ncbi:MAG: YwhD family protein [Firmicutes bacterium]|uniref:YwhD family protein n=1 Tax=Melghirimyces thermohalophilus TaxID=1236220 RepID=A0A1G6M6P1_9BACL|nr:YwhD family protein [Melghirimyces thermohalophilus]MDA8351699.1 YwhD family protein [Bacillota bacterium]SDC51218.1 YwhD family protein [Melghirimyces thermohalophilus]
MSKKKNSGFNIIRGDSTTHKGYYTGTLNLSDLSGVLIDGDEATLDLGLIHAKSKVERKIKFESDPQAVPDGKEYWVVWVAGDRNEHGPYYAGAAACPMRINREARRGWKNLAHHVNQMDAALKRKYRLSDLPEREKGALRKLLIENNEQMWNNSPDELKEALATEK